MTDQTCAFCKFYVSETGVGDCRRRAPFVTGGLHSAVETVWPQVGEAEFCGDFESSLLREPEETFSTPPKCAHCKDGAISPTDMTAEWKCPRCGADTMPF